MNTKVPRHHLSSRLVAVCLACKEDPAEGACARIPRRASAITSRGGAMRTVTGARGCSVRRFLLGTGLAERYGGEPLSIQVRQRGTGWLAGRGRRPCLCPARTLALIPAGGAGRPAYWELSSRQRGGADGGSPEEAADAVEAGARLALAFPRSIPASPATVPAWRVSPAAKRLTPPVAEVAGE